MHAHVRDMASYLEQMNAGQKSNFQIGDAGSLPLLGAAIGARTAKRREAEPTQDVVTSPDQQEIWLSSAHYETWWPGPGERERDTVWRRWIPSLDDTLTTTERMQVLELCKKEAGRIGTKSGTRCGIWPSAAAFNRRYYCDDPSLSRGRQPALMLMSATGGCTEAGPGPPAAGESPGPVHRAVAFFVPAAPKGAPEVGKKEKKRKRARRVGDGQTHALARLLWLFGAVWRAGEKHGRGDPVTQQPARRPAGGRSRRSPVVSSDGREGQDTGRRNAGKRAIRHGKWLNAVVTFTLRAQCDEITTLPSTVRDAPSDKVANLSLDTDADADAWDRGPPAQAFLVRGSWTSFRRTVISCCCCCIGRSKPVCWLRAGGVYASLHACELSSRGCAETERERQREAHNAAAVRHVSRAASQRATGQRWQQQQRQVSFSLQPRTDASPHLLHSLSLFAFLVAPRRRGFSHEMRGRYIPHTVPGSVGAAAAAAAASPEQDGMDDGRGSTASCPSQPQRQASSRAARPQSNTVVNWHGRVAR
ncbi:hypothetical protein PCL_06021 [Purpureocillium lilacinum]|uniref:Uncharacterized protein n=1 Tax=Purpureocillium lilacinum TaxID=33203 RepID=A0A2U3ELJ7_PURLI|nr:hypothetical protein PCL_06021 [Purpureocillium lilacinum]